LGRSGRGLVLIPSWEDAASEQSMSDTKVVTNPLCLAGFALLHFFRFWGARSNEAAGRATTTFGTILRCKDVGRDRYLWLCGTASGSDLWNIRGFFCTPTHLRARECGWPGVTGNLRRFLL